MAKTACKFVSRIGDFDICHNPDVRNVIAFEGEGYEVFSPIARVGVFRTLERATTYAESKSASAA